MGSQRGSNEAKMILTERLSQLGFFSVGKKRLRESY